MGQYLLIIAIILQGNFFFSWKKVFKILDLWKHLNQILVGLGKGLMIFTYYIS